MKKIMVLFSFLIIVNSISTNKFDEAYYKASKLYSNGQYKESLELYESLEPQGPVTYYNRGVVLCSMKRNREALVMWKIALLYANTALLKKIKNNYERIQKKIGEEFYSPWFWRVLFFSSYISLFFLQIFFLVLLFFYSLFMVTYPDLCNRYYHSCCLAILFFLSLLLFYFYKESISRKGVVILDEVSLFAAPNDEVGTVGVFRIGTDVTIVGDEELWYKVQNKDLYGWIKKDTVQEIKL